MRGSKVGAGRNRPPKRVHTSIELQDHAAVLNEIIAHPSRFDIPEFFKFDREKVLITAGKGVRRLTPDLILYHDDSSVTIIEAASSPNAEKAKDDTECLQRARAHFKSKGVECRCLRVWLEDGEPKHATPVDILFDEIADQMVGQ